MELYDHIRKISFVFFFIIGLVHFLAGLLHVNGYLPATSLLVNRMLFIPFVISALSFSLSNAKYHLMEYGKTQKTWDYIFLGIWIIVFLAFLAIELLLPDSPTPLVPDI